MSLVTAVIFLHQPAGDERPLTALLREAQRRVARRHMRLFAAAGADVEVDVGSGQFAARLRRHAGWSGLVVLSAGAVPLLRQQDAERLVAVAGAGGDRALTNNRFSSDVCAIGTPAVLSALPDMPTDNALPRWLEEACGFAVDELPARDRLAFDLDSPLDLALLAATGRGPRRLRRLAEEASLTVPRLDELRALAADPRGELLVFGRSSAGVLRWLERNVACRVRFLAEERGLRASSPLAHGGTPGPGVLARPPRATLGRLLAERGPEALAATVEELADGALVDSRVLLADRLGADESAWPAPEDRFASDLLRASSVADPWLAALTASAGTSSRPVMLGGHTLVGPGLRLALGRREGTAKALR